MKKLLYLLILPLLALTAFGAATITGPIADLTGGSWGSRIEFWPQSTPFFTGTTAIVGPMRSVAITNGNFSTSLVAGRYLCKFPPTVNQFYVYVPTGTATYTLSDITTNVFVVITLGDLAGATNQTPLLQDVNGATYSITNLGGVGIGANELTSWDQVTNYFTQSGAGGDVMAAELVSATNLTWILSSNYTYTATLGGFVSAATATNIATGVAAADSIPRSAGHGTNVVSHDALYVDTTKLTDNGAGKLIAESGFSGNGSSLTALAAANITAGGTLPGLNGSGLTNLTLSSFTNAGTAAYSNATAFIKAGSGGTVDRKSVV